MWERFNFRPRVLVGKGASPSLTANCAASPDKGAPMFADLVKVLVIYMFAWELIVMNQIELHHRRFMYAYICRDALLSRPDKM